MATNSGVSLSLLRLIRCIIGPKLRRMYYQDRHNQAYVSNKFESYADHVILAAYLICSFIYHISPFYFVYYLLRNGVPTFAGVLGTVKTLAVIPISFSLAYVVRGVGRYRNPTYNQFLTSLSAARNFRGRLGPAEASSTGIDGYDFEMRAYPVTFRHSESLIKAKKLSTPRRKGLFEKLLHFPLSSLRYVVAHLIARRMVYPGSVAIFNLALETPLSEGRANLRRNFNSYRAKLLTADGNYIDTIFIDRRGSPDIGANGNKLIICCEGNAGYYEIGLPTVPLNMGYSVIGWNHPGFAESTGLPFPEQECHAMDTVMKYAVTHLRFEFENIVILAWSIGGYTASWAAMSYPNIGGVILDATFDELYPLAKLRVPQIFQGFTRGVIDEYYNLNIAEQICHYYGPVTLIRRQNDEMMTQNNDVSTNRANYLLIKILQNRYPNLVSSETIKELWVWLNAPADWVRSQVLQANGVSTSECKRRLIQYISDHGRDYPYIIGGDFTVKVKTQMLLYLASLYMLHYDSTHCNPIPYSYIVDLPKLH